jgi:methyl-accepting chemotaxis protein
MAPNTDTILIIFVAIVGALVLLQALVLVGIFIALRKAASSALAASGDFKATILPTIHATRELVERISPQIVIISTSLAELSELLKRESRGVSVSATEIMARVNRQSQRLDGMLTNGLDAVERAGQVVETAVAAPIRQANGIMAAIKAMIETYRSSGSRPSPVYPNADIDPLDPLDPGI